ncbi:phosphoribosylanthranilate isomerase [Novisyntrophococcus fermenticellae]|uniref:phosphoribosylanthranilate isomerase n=1 Tax=Novisyntrophococcus fermenticellae TaxID=2068655 RepID=UPI001E596953|nr:phosphoribosylanthranilate isomerase [Novisyntrophococcus fermenticellae]
MTKIKICGLSRLCDVDYVNAFQPDYVGFVFAKSRRQISREHAITLRMNLNPDITVVGVFVNELAKIAGAYAEDGVIDMIQLHGQEDEVYIRNLRYQTGCEIIKSFSIQSGEDVKRACGSSADYILLDHGSGGTGQSFNWEFIDRIDRPWFLAGGMDQENVEEAVRKFHPYGVDISSGVETDGVKDEQKIEACVRRIRNV